MILCCGESLIDMIPQKTSQGLDCYSPHPGGSIFNTSIALGRLGVKTLFLTGLSNDLFGTLIQDSLTKSNVDTGLALISNHPTTLAFVNLVNGSATYTFYDENTAGRCLNLTQIPKIPDNISALYFGGISLCTEPCGSFYEAILTNAAAHHVIMLDPNIRPNFIQNESQYRARLTRLISKTDIIKVSDDDLNWIIPGSGTLEEKFSTLATFGPTLSILTMGKDGIKCLSKSGLSISIPAMEAIVVDTVGAGDTFNAGFIGSLSNLGVLSKMALGTIDQYTLTLALEYGAKVAAITVSRSGANPPWISEMS